MNFKCQKSGCGGNNHTQKYRYSTGTGGEPNANAEQQSRARQGNALPPNVTGAGNDGEATVAATGANANFYKLYCEDRRPYLVASSPRH